MSFKEFSQLVHNQFSTMTTHNLLEVDIDLYDHYLAAFPEGTNPIFRVRTEHDCSCCRQFIRNLGNVIAIVSNTTVTVWDYAALHAPYPYNVVAERLSQLVKQANIKGIYGASPKHYTFGANVTYDPKADVNWHHFHAVVPQAHRRTPEQIGDINTTFAVLQRGLTMPDVLSNLSAVQELIDSNNLYRGAEHKRSVEAFMDLVVRFQASPNKAAFIWENIRHPQARFRNTVIGSLVVDLCDGVDLERAVASFEAKVAPQNYKRPKALITPRMIDEALETLDRLNLRPALDRRHATFSDLSVNNVLFVDNSVQPLFKDGLKDALLSQVKPTAPDTKNAKPITLDGLLKLKPTSMSLLVENRHLGNFMSITAPKHPDTGQLFKWANDFAWSYDGNITDSIRERVKKAGGNVDNAAMRISLSWFNRDDLDLHVIEPNGNHIYYANKSGKLDVDMNISGETREAVENVSYRPGQILPGRYVVIVNNFRRRESIDVGFDLEFFLNGETRTFNFASMVGSDTAAITFTIENGRLADLKMHPGVTESSRSQVKWGVTTQTFVPVQTLTISPNHWDKPIGNMHWFFILKDCKNPLPTRGIYNEFLSADLEKHRKVFEILGDKTKVEPSQDQLSGLGFSSTLNEEVFVQVNNATTYKVKL